MITCWVDSEKMYSSNIKHGLDALDLLRHVVLSTRDSASENLMIETKQIWKWIRPYVYKQDTKITIS